MSRQDCKVFIGGLSWETTDEKLRTYFLNYGTVHEAFVSYDRHTGRPRGFGFVVFEDPGVADKVVSLQHTIDRREVDAKKAVPKDDSGPGKQALPNGMGQGRSKKIFVGGLAPSVDETAFRRHFERFGSVEDAVVMYDHDNRRPRGFGFVTFCDEGAIDGVFSSGIMQTLHDKPIEIKRAVPRDQMPPSYPPSSYAALGSSHDPHLGLGLNGLPHDSASMASFYETLQRNGGNLPGSRQQPLSANPQVLRPSLSSAFSSSLSENSLVKQW
ncbi:hypothetical protein WJX84_005922 [Apatococcus fuscideae]|uniref:RRM domain-containing protein n=1 Tax=Apatococcus fuscideae TaxID=2026836 RepID=A0AAW1T7K8_9CHLO